MFSILFLIMSFAVISFAQYTEARNVDEFGNIYCDDYLARIDVLLVELKNSPDSKEYIFVYEGKTRMALYDKNNKYAGEKYILPHFGQALKTIETMKKRMKLYRVDMKRLFFIKGGFRKNFTVDLWIVPKGAPPPKPTPTLNKMKYRKGKPSGFCLSM